MQLNHFGEFMEDEILAIQHKIESISSLCWNIIVVMKHGDESAYWKVRLVELQQEIANLNDEMVELILLGQDSRALRDKGL